MEEVQKQSKLKDWTDALVGLVLVLLVAAQFGQFAYMSWSQQNLRDITNRENGYKNRAVNCIIVTEQGKPVPDVCREPEVSKYLPVP